MSAKLFLIVLLLIGSVGRTSAQTTPASEEAKSSAENKTPISPLSQPDDLKFLLLTEDERATFHLGEIIDVKLGFSSASFGRYSHFQPASRYPGASPFQISCEPSDGVIDRLDNTGRLSASTMFYTGTGCGMGSGGGGIGGGCFDCTSDLPVTEKPDWWFKIVLNYQQQFRKPGEYSCTAQTSDVRLTASSAENPTVFKLISAPLKLRVVNDPSWSQTALAWASRKIETKACATQAMADIRCSQSAQVIRFLDTEDSLKIAVQLFGEASLSFAQQEMWSAILQTSNKKLAVELLDKRMLEPDFAITQSFLETLVALKLREESPSAFKAGANPGDYHDRALALLEEYVRDVGQSLIKKQPTAIKDSLETYRRYAGQSFYGEGPLIPDSEMQATLAGLRSQN